MVDYVPTEIVAYAEYNSDTLGLLPNYFKIDSEIVYRNYQPDYYVDYYIEFKPSNWFTLTMPITYNSIQFTWTPYNPTASQSEWAYIMLFTVKSLYYFDGLHYDYTEEEGRALYGGKYYLLSYADNLDGYYFVNCPETDIWVVPPEANAEPYHPEPVLPTKTNSSDDIYFLYDVGKTIVKFLSPVSSILSYDIGGGLSLATLLFSGGFGVYMGWCIIKWFLPT